MGVYPFMFGAAKDFEPIVEDLDKVCRFESMSTLCTLDKNSRNIQRGLKEPYDWDEYAAAFFPQAEKLVNEAAIAEIDGNKHKASEFYLYCFSVLAFGKVKTNRRAGEAPPSTESLAFPPHVLRSKNMHGQRVKRRPSRV